MGFRTWRVVGELPPRREMVAGPENLPALHLMLKVLPEATTWPSAGALMTAYPGVASWARAEAAKARIEAKMVERILRQLIEQYLPSEVRIRMREHEERQKGKMSPKRSNTETRPGKE